MFMCRLHCVSPHVGLVIDAQEYAANPQANWGAKDAAMYTMLALSVQGATAAGGVVKLNQHVNIGEFFTNDVCPHSPFLYLSRRRSQHVDIAQTRHSVLNSPS
jgi:hypothetical protein